MSSIINPIFLLNLPRVDTMSDLAWHLKLSESTLYHLSYKKNQFYKEVKMLKKDGGFRNLSCPSNKIKAVQAWILRNILDKIPTNENATGFIRKKGIKENLIKHEGNAFFLCLDIKDFFSSIPEKKIYNFFINLGYNKKISMIFMNYCSYNGSLPQGGVTSPTLSNLLNIRLDKRISGYASKNNLVYSRYADDITLSSNSADKLIRSMKTISSIIEEEGYKLNSKKTRLLRPGAKRKITGLIYNDQEEIRVGNKTKRLLRAKIHSLKNGSNIEMDHLFHVLGWMAFLKDNDIKTYNQLNQYSKFTSEQIKLNVAVAKEYNVDPPKPR